MDATKTINIIKAQVAPAADDPNDDIDQEQLPNDFANRAGWLATINQVTQVDIPKQYKGIDVLSIINQPGGVREKLYINKAINVNEPAFKSAIATLSGKDPLS